MSYLTRHSAPARPALRLVCFPHAGGGASFFRSWPAHLDPSTELLAVQYPGRENRFREPLVPDLATLADAVAEHLRPLPPLPTVLFGHSMGAAVAYETLLRLEAAGDSPVLRLCVSGRAPDTAPGPGDHTDEQLVRTVQELGGTQAAVLDDPDLRELLLPIIRNDYRLIDRYRRSPDAPRLRADLLALTGDRDPQVTVEQARGWAATTDGAFSLHVLAGDHFYLVPAAAEVARLAASVYPSTAGNT
ncbi:thioesterase II family protein [Kitasatospora sp. NPDC058162]|uniref:thioesterase II family protein n=1 Tax=Kitasatospora sp. NPDC058162 TaxID=3346362 RepID=UPI0036DF5E28